MKQILVDFFNLIRGIFSSFFSNFWKWFHFGLFAGTLVLFLTIVSNRTIIDFSESFVFDSHENIPKNEVALVLGTSKYSRRGINPYFKHRMDATLKLYKKGKIKHIVVSGDNHKHGYNEPQQMMDYLINLGVPKNKITLDYAGFRTFDSVIRIKEIFGQNKVTIISQKFHNERAVFLARKNDIDAVAYNAKTPWYSKRMRFREYLAKCKAILDVYVLKTKPKFLGEKIEIRS
ncbi:MAG: SanA/YdcF family protein [Flavobacteriales bacterium]